MLFISIPYDTFSIQSKLKFKMSASNSESQKINLAGLDANVPSLCIPRVFSNITRERVMAAFKDLNLGFVERIDMIPCTAPNGDRFQRVFVHLRWRFSDQSDKARTRLLSGGEIKVIYDEPWFWKITANRSTRNEDGDHSRSRGDLRKPKFCASLVLEDEEVDIESGIRTIKAQNDRERRPMQSNQGYDRRSNDDRRPMQGSDRRPYSDQRSSNRDELGEQGYNRRPSNQSYDHRPYSDPRSSNRDELGDQRAPNRRPMQSNDRRSYNKLDDFVVPSRSGSQQDRKQEQAQRSALSLMNPDVTVESAEGSRTPTMLPPPDSEPRTPEGLPPPAAEEETIVIPNVVVPKRVAPNRTEAQKTGKKNGKKTSTGKK